MNDVFLNLDFLFVGIAVAANVIMGFVIFLNDPKSDTSILFLFQTLILAIWSSANYLCYQFLQPQIALILERLVLFFAVPNSIVFLLLMHTFPEPRMKMKKKWITALLSLMGITMLWTLTPYVFSSVTFSAGQVPQPTVEPGMALFMFTAVLSIPVALWFLVRKYRNSLPSEKPRLKYLLWGVTIMFGLIVIFDVAFPVFLENSRFIPLSAVFTLPFVALTAYAIGKHHLLQVKIVATEVLTFILAIVTLFEVMISRTASAIIFRSGVFLLVLSFSVLLIKSVIREVKQREKLEVLTKELESANVKLQEADKMKSQFLSFASHQVKSPMTVVKDYADLIRDGSYGIIPEKVKETAQKIHDSADRLIALVNNLLDLRKLEEGKVEYDFVKMDFDALVKNIFTEMKTLADKKGLEMTLEIPGEPIKVKGDTEKLRQVMQNFIDNSVKYTEKGWIKISVTTANKKVRLAVSDSGLGIPHDLIPTLFEQFNRGSKEAKKIQGTGLGLYIAKKFMEAHGGKVWAESRGPGFGSTFTMEMDMI